MKVWSEQSLPGENEWSSDSPTPQSLLDDAFRIALRSIANIIENPMAVA